MADGDHNGIDSIVCGAGEVSTLKQPIRFGVADYRLNGISASDFTLGRRSGDAAVLGDVDLGLSAILVAL